MCTTPDDPMEPKERRRPLISSSEGRRDCVGDKIAGVRAREREGAEACARIGSQADIDKVHRLSAACTEDNVRTRSMAWDLFLSFVSVPYGPALVRRATKSGRVRLLIFGLP
jgi:hypothetical protein